jgi:dinuclear metal center YbgI/SA1388 family protein
LGIEMPAISDMLDFLKEFAPLSLAAAWDNVGLLLGDDTVPLRGVMTCLTLTPEVAREAIGAGANLIVAHHPILFHPIKRLTAGTAEGRMLLELTGAHIAVYSPHTAFDKCAGGINDIIAQRLGLADCTPLQDQEGPRQCKIVAFVPDQDLAKVAAALFAAGAGHIGQYSQCSFRLAGTGTFFGSEATHPVVGEKGRREEVSEWRLEAICPEASLTEALAALRRAHSYEEPAYDVYPLRVEPNRFGVGRLGALPQPTSLQSLGQIVKTALAANYVQMMGDLNRLVRSVAIVCGAGADFVDAAVAKKADVLLTGEARFHQVLAAKNQGMALLLPGHYATERCGIEELAKHLQTQFAGVPIWPSRVEADPFL